MANSVTNIFETRPQAANGVWIQAKQLHQWLEIELEYSEWCATIVEHYRVALGMDLMLTAESAGSNRAVHTYLFSAQLVKRIALNEGNADLLKLVSERDEKWWAVIPDDVCKIIQWRIEDIVRSGRYEMDEATLRGAVTQELLRNAGVSRIEDIPKGRSQYLQIQLIRQLEFCAAHGVFHYQSLAQQILPLPKPDLGHRLIISLPMDGTLVRTLMDERLAFVHQLDGMSRQSLLNMDGMTPATLDDLERALVLTGNKGCLIN